MEGYLVAGLKWIKKKRQGTLKKSLYVYFFKVLLFTGLFINLILLSFFAYREQEVILSGKRWILYQTITYADRIMEEVESIGEAIWTSSQVQDLKVTNLQEINYMSFLNCMKYLTNMELSVSPIHQIRLYYEDTNTLITSRDGVFYNLNEEECKYYQRWMNSLDKSVWACGFSYSLLDAIDAKERAIHHVRPIYSSSTGKKIGLLSIEVSLQIFNELINQENGEKEGFFIIKDGNILTDKTHNEEVIKNWSQEDGIIGKIKDNKDGSADFDHSRQRYRCVYVTSEYSGWTFITYYPYTYSIFGQLPLLVVIFLFLSLVIAYIMIIRISKNNVIQPVETLQDAMKQIEEGQFGIQIQEKRLDVFGDIFYYFNRMSVRSKELIEELIIERLRIKDSKLKMLQSQIKPHFLYNIFNNMIWMSEKKNYDGLDKMIYAIVGYYKTSLNFGKDFISLADNLKQLKYYSMIQQMRFPDRFEYDIVFDKDILSLEIPNLLLQPILENAINYGVTKKEWKTSIRIRGYKKDQTIFFEFYDNGVGIEKKHLERIRDAINQDGYKGTDFFALTNVAERLRIYYSNKGKITIDSSFGEWTFVVISLPAEGSLCLD